MNTYKIDQTIEGIKFKQNTPDHMKKYVLFLRYHHEYSNEKLLKNFSEYIIEIKQF